MGIESNSNLRSFLARLLAWIGMVVRVLKTMARRLYDFLIPPRCLACGMMIPDSHAVCADCWRELDFIVKPWCSRCGEPFAYEPAGVADGVELLCATCSGDATPRFDRLRAVLAYNDGSRALILPFKHSDHTETARLFAKWLVAFGAEALVGVDCIAPVPLHRFRLWHRRYNQSALIAWEVGKITGIRVIPDLIERRRATASQG
ncbi:MAG: double zinc ribbon domain-containing protein, partial [Alphaproteobacteria bacterium]|nr:double zinc ribbon domain-containing protein [Alphaproteobacteria bacterium]